MALGEFIAKITLEGSWTKFVLYLSMAPHSNEGRKIWVRALAQVSHLPEYMYGAGYLITL